MADYSKLRSDDPKVQQARQRAGRIVNAMNDLATLVQEAWDNEDHRVLGYDSWQSYTVAEFGHGDTAVKARQIIVGLLRGTNLSQRAIAAQVGVSVATINNDLGDLTAQPPDGDPTTVDRRPTVQPVEQSATITGLDGRTRPADRGGMDGDERRARRRERDLARARNRILPPIDNPRSLEPTAVTTPPSGSTSMTEAQREAHREQLTRRDEARILLAANFNARFRQWLDTLSVEQLDELEENWENLMRTALAAMASWIGAHRRAS